VYDYAYLLDEYEEAAIESLLMDVDNATGNEIVVVTLVNLDEFNGDIDMARYRYFNDIPLEGVTGIGKKELNNGVLIIVAWDESEWGLEVGYGLEGELTDSETGRIARKSIVPYFGEGDYYTGLFVCSALVAEEIGYDVERFDPGTGGDSGSSLIDVLLEEDPFYILYWLFSSGFDVAVVLIVILILLALFTGGGKFLRGVAGGGGRSGGGGASGRW